jgi:hypothetical protein
MKTKEEEEDYFSSQRRALLGRVPRLLTLSPSVRSKSSNKKKNTQECPTLILLVCCCCCCRALARREKWTAVVCPSLLVLGNTLAKTLTFP